MSTTAITRQGMTPEERARANGYTGVFPPPPYRIANTAGFRDALAEMREGDHRPNIVRAASRYLRQCFLQVQPADARLMARNLLEIVQNPKNWSSAKFAAIKAGIESVYALIQLVPQLRKRKQPELVLHVESLLYEFLDEMGDEGYRQLGRGLRSLLDGTTPNGKPLSAETRARDTSRVLTTLTGLLEKATELQDMRGRQSLPPADDVLVLEAEQQLKIIEAEVTDAA